VIQPNVRMTIKRATLRRPVAAFMAVVLAAASLFIFSGTALAFTGSGAGTVGSPYQITTCVQLQEMNDDLDAHYILMNDIDCSDTVSWNAGAGFVPIMDSDCIDPFTGTLDGNNHTISDLFMNYDGICAGLFGYVDSATISDLSLNNIDITATDDYAGGLVGYADSGVTIANVHVTGTITGQYYIGGVAGLLNGDSITESSSTVTITGESDLGGLVGQSEGTIERSYATGSLSGYELVGGLVGTSSSGIISDSYATGNADASGGTAGGLVGFSGGTVTNSYSTGSVTGDTNLGGLVGSNGGTVTTSFWDTQTSGRATSDGGTGKTTAEMKNIATFATVGWDFATVWDINGTDNHGYPFLRWQTFSAPTDGDGVSDTVEDAAPNSGDGNNDGTSDSQQANVVSFVNPITDKYITLEVNSSCTLTAANSAAESANAVADSGFDYPVGLINFTANCGTPGFAATVTQYFYGVSDTNFVLRKYNPGTHAYSTVSGVAISQITIGGQTVAKAVYQVTDGGPLDTDGAANGTIVDPVGLAQSSVGVPNTGLGGGRD
jgi:hypothetical protein